VYSRVLVPLDGSRLAEQVLPHAEALASGFGATILLLRATTPLEQLLTAEAAAAGIALAPVLDPEPILAAEQEAARDYLEQVERRLGQLGLKVEREVVAARASDAIVERAAAQGADLIAMTTHGRSGLGRLLLGSTADEVLRHAPCPVLLVRVREDGSEA
jgi:nucleotide-binding universal stress UspA family protein